MSSWILVPCLVCLRDEFNELSPSRDKGADGSIGDTAHSSSSDHTPDEDSAVLRGKDADNDNEVHGLDIDSSGPWPGTGTQKERFHRIVMRIIAGEKAKWLNPSDRCRLRYVIWDRKIYHIDNDFEPRDYTLEDPHTNHAHFSSRYETACENDRRPWGVIEEDDGMAGITQNDFNARMDAWWNDRMSVGANNAAGDELAKLRRAAWNQSVGGTDTTYQWMARAAQASQALTAIQALATAFSAFVTAEGVDDANVQAKLAEMNATLEEIQAALPAV